MDFKQKAQEILLSSKDPVYFIENFLQTFDQTQNGMVPFKLFRRQQDIVRAFQKERFHLVLKYRQAGISTISTAFAVWLLLFSSKESPERVLIVANKLDTAKMMLKKIKDFYAQVPEWMLDILEHQQVKNSETHIGFSNACEAKALATSADALRGFTPTFLFVDEAAHIDQGEDFWASAQAALSTGGKCCLLSTPKGMDPIFYKTYENAKKKKNDYLIHHIKWFEDPRYNKHLTWKKDDLVLTDVKEDAWYDLESKGFEPTSPWFQTMCRQFNDNKQLIAQELLADFITSGGNVIDGSVIKKIEEVDICEPIRKEYDGNFWIWEEPIKGDTYCIAIDVSRGDSKDFSTIQILNYNTMVQVAEYQGKIPPDILGELCFTYAMRYNNAFAIIDITGGMGVATSLKMYELGYRNFYWETRGKPIDGDLYRNNGIVPGFQINMFRSLLIESLERNLRNNFFIVKSSRALSEMKTFTFKNGRADHSSSTHDDLIIALAMGLYVQERNFKATQMYQEAIKSSLEGWIDYRPNKTEIKQNKKYKQDFYTSSNSHVPDEVINNMWLFF